MKKIVVSLCMLVAFIVAPLVSQAATLEDGKYSLPYQVNNSGSTSASYGNDYFVKPATLVKKDGQMYVQFTVKNSAWIHTLNGHEGGNKVLSKNESADTRVVQFNISNPFGKTVVDMKIDVDELNYHHEYTVDFVWFGDQATLIESYAKPAVKEAQASAATSQAPSTNTQPKQTEQKKAEVQQPVVAEKKQQSVAATETKQDDKTQTQSTDTKVAEEKESEQLAEDKKEEQQTENVQQDDKKVEEQLTEDKKQEAVEETEEVKQIEQVNETANQANEVEDAPSSGVLWISLSVIVVILVVAAFLFTRKKKKIAK